MPAIEKLSLLARLRHTKVTELLHGRISSGQTPQQVLAASGLDASTRSLITDIVKRTRLWNDERVDVARELIAHFADARDAGESSEKTIRAFGDPDAAARLIRRAKIRNRSLLWHALRFLRRAAGVLVLVYIGLAIYFFSGKPNVKTDYVARLNEPVLKIPESDRAWPFYREFGELFDVEQKTWNLEFSVYPDRSPKRWPAVVEWLQAHPQYLELADKATTRPHLGFVFGPDGSVRELKSFANTQTDPKDPMFKSVISVLLPQLNYLRGMANMLAADAKLAAEQNDTQRWLKRMNQIAVVGDHAEEPGFLINNLVQIGIEAMRLDQIERMLESHPTLLSDEQLAALAHRNARYNVPADLLSFRTERMGFEDIVQRVYTDDGHGNGRISPSGLDNLRLVSNPSDGGLFPSNGNPAIEATKVMLTPAAVLAFASRKELTDRYNSIMDKADARLHRPWRERDSDPMMVEVQGIQSSFREFVKYRLIALLVPSLDRTIVTAERVITKRDALQVAIALELFRRRSGNYPATLEEMTPRLLPSVPVDPADGKPMRYKLVDGKPLVYSVGVDLDDDGGTFPQPRTARRAPAHVYSLAIGESDVKFDGDWILYPEPYIPDAGEEDSTTLPVAEPSTQPAG